MDPPTEHADHQHPMLHSFGDERIECIIGRLEPMQVLTMLRNPEDAVTRDIPNLVFFNLDLPFNHTMRTDGDQGEVQVHQRQKGKARGKWRPLPESAQLLKACLRHFNKFIDFARSQRITAMLTPVETKLLSDYMGALESGRDFRFSRHYPGYETIAGFSCVDPESQSVSIERVVQAIIGVARENCALPKEDWVCTVPYASEALS